VREYGTYEPFGVLPEDVVPEVSNAIRARQTFTICHSLSDRSGHDNSARFGRQAANRHGKRARSSQIGALGQIWGRFSLFAAGFRNRSHENDHAGPVWRCSFPGIPTLKLMAALQNSHSTDAIW
jgi:hypothetical protein